MSRLSWGNPETVDCLEKVLRAGGVVLAEGDTVLGLLADVSAQGRAHLDHIKSRSKKPYLILVESRKKALKLIETGGHKPLQIEKIMDACWPGPATLIFKGKAGGDLYSQSADGTVAIRVPDHAGLLALLKRFDALFSTSANSAGELVPSSIDVVDGSIMSSVAAVVVNDGHEKSQSSLPSTIIDCTGDQLVVVRQGAFDASVLQQ